MSGDEQRALLVTFIDSMKAKLLERSGKWPAEWDGHELRELAADAFDAQRTALMKSSRKRLRDYRNACTVDLLW
jgi:hypothetical protein